MCDESGCGGGVCGYGREFEESRAGLRSVYWEGL